MAHELRYFQEIHAVAPDVQTLWELKCRYILDDLFQAPENLKIYFEGREEWVFDYLPTKREASQVLADASLPWTECAKSQEKWLRKFFKVRGGRVK